MSQQSRGDSDDDIFERNIHQLDRETPSCNLSEEDDRNSSKSNPNQNPVKIKTNTDRTNQDVIQTLTAQAANYPTKANSNSVPSSPFVERNRKQSTSAPVMNSLLKSNPGNTLQENLYNSLQPIPDQPFTEHDGTQAVLKSPHLSVHSARPMNPTTVVTSSSSVGYQNQNNMNVSSVSGNVASIVPFSHPQKTIATKGAHYQAQMMKNIKAASNTHLQPYPQGSWVSYPSDPQYNGNSAAPVETLISQPTATFSCIA
jgi:hypothetical protein